MNIATCKLYEFIKIASINNIDFPRIMYDCYAIKFLKNKYNPPYEIDDYYLRESEEYKFYVTYILQKSYVMFEIEDKILLWVGYTNENERRKDYMTAILKDIILQFPDKEIVGHTYNEDLIKIFKKLKIINKSN